MNDLIVKDVDLFGDNIIAAQDKDGVIWAGVKWLCDGLGLSEGQVKSERKKINEDLVLSKGGRNFILPTNGGNQEVLCLQLDYVPLWLAKISITPKMKENNPELVDKLVKYQLEAKDVLAKAFLPKDKTSELSPQTQLILQLAQSIADKEIADKERDRKITEVTETANKAIKSVENIKEVVQPVTDDWRNEMNKKVNRIQRSSDKQFDMLRFEMYSKLEKRAGCNLNTRIRNARRRMQDAGCSKSEINSFNKMDIIDKDKKLREIFSKIVSEYEIKYCT